MLANREVLAQGRGELVDADVNKVQGLDPEELSVSSKAVAIDILVNGARSRTHLASKMGLSPATLTRLVRPLVESGVLVESTSVRTPGRGRSSWLLDVVPEDYRFIGVKLTTESIYAVVTDLRAHIFAEEVAALPSLQVPDAVARVTDVVNRLSARAGRPVNGLGVTVGGKVHAGEVVADSPFLHWRDVPFRSLLAENLDIPVHLDNDVVGLTKAQQWFGHGRGHTNFALLTMGAGIGYGLVINGTMIPTEISPVSHFPVDPSGPLCPLGHRGCTTAYLTSDAITSAVSIGHNRKIEFDEVLALVKQQDPIAGRVVQDAGRALGRTITAIATLTGVELIILSGEGVHITEVAEAAIAEGRCDYAVGRVPGCRVVTRSMDFLEWARGAAVLAIQSEFPQASQMQDIPSN
ncbi:ROK family protein [Arthrobacter sp. D3-16]